MPRCIRCEIAQCGGCPGTSAVVAEGNLNVLRHTINHYIMMSPRCQYAFSHMGILHLIYYVHRRIVRGDREVAVRNPKNAKNSARIPQTNTSYYYNIYVFEIFIIICTAGMAGSPPPASVPLSRYTFRICVVVFIPQLEPVGLKTRINSLWWCARVTLARLQDYVRWRHTF